MTQDSNSPDQVQPSDDSGADALSRFSYQACYTAMLGLDLLDPESEHSELFCEHHEDLLIKERAGSFKGVQVKTRKPGLGPFKTSDDEILKALSKFVQLEIKFSDQFSRYILVTSCGVWREKKNQENLEYVLECIPENDAQVEADCAKTPLKKLFKSLTAIKGSTPVLVAKTLRKTRTAISPDLNSIDAKLLELLTGLPHTATCNGTDLKKIILALKSKVLAASTRDEQASAFTYIPFSKDPDKEKLILTISQKTLRANDFSAIITENKSNDASLRSWKAIPISELPKGMKRLEKKMIRGGLEVAEVGLCKDLKYSTESLLTQLAYKLPAQKAQSQYEHVRVAVKNDCLEAKEQASGAGGLYGSKMLKDLRQKLRDRTKSEGQIHGFSYEHLLGMAAILTEECEVWWSERFDIDEEPKE